MEGGYGGGGPHRGVIRGWGRYLDLRVYSLPPIQSFTYPNKISLSY